MKGGDPRKKKNRPEPARPPTAAAATVVPWSSAMKNATGRCVSGGGPTSHPPDPKLAPHSRPAACGPDSGEGVRDERIGAPGCPLGRTGAGPDVRRESERGRRKDLGGMPAAGRPGQVSIWLAQETPGAHDLGCRRRPNFHPRERGAGCPGSPESHSGSSSSRNEAGHAESSRVLNSGHVGKPPRRSAATVGRRCPRWTSGGGGLAVAVEQSLAAGRHRERRAERQVRRGPSRRRRNSSEGGNDDGRRPGRASSVPHS